METPSYSFNWSISRSGSPMLSSEAFSSRYPVCRLLAYKLAPVTVVMLAPENISHGNKINV